MEEVEDARFPPPPRACPRVRERGRRGRGKEGTRGSSCDGNNFYREREKGRRSGEKEHGRGRRRERKKGKRKLEKILLATKISGERERETRERRVSSPCDGSNFRRKEMRGEKDKGEGSGRREKKM